MIGVVTDDGSITCFNEKYQEYYHALTGAMEEAIEKHAKPAIDFLIKNKKLDLNSINSINSIDTNSELNVLDFCFGFGYNAYAFIQEIRKLNKNIKINVIGLDNDSEVVELGNEIFKDFLEKNIKNDKNIKFEIIIGDAKETVKNLKIKFDVCFFDPFSPGKCPELWTENVFKEVYSKMKQQSILTTYSCAKMMRENMKKASFDVIDGPFVKRYSPGTLGIKK